MIETWLHVIDPATGDEAKDHPWHDLRVVMPIIPRVAETVVLLEEGGHEREWTVEAVRHRVYRDLSKTDERADGPTVTVVLTRGGGG